MEVGAIVEHGVERGKADGAAEVAGEVEQAGGILHALGRERAERHIGDRHHGEHQADPAQDLRHEQLPEIEVLGEVAHLPGAGRERHEPEHQHEARIDLVHEPADDRRAHEHGDAGDEHGLADHERVVAADAREIERIEIGEAVEPDPEHEREHAAEREVAIGEGPQIDDRLARREDARRKNATAESAETTAKNVIGRVIEPVVARAFLQHVFERAEERRHEDKAGPVKMLEQREVRLVEIDQHERRGATAMPGMMLMKNSQCQDNASVR